MSEKKLRKIARKLLRYARKHDINYIDVSAFGYMGVATCYMRETETSNAVTVTVYDDKEVEQ